MRKMRVGMEVDHEKRMRKAVKRSRAEILDNVSVDDTNDAILDLSMLSPLIETFNEKNTGMTGIERGYNDR